MLVSYVQGVELKKMGNYFWHAAWFDWIAAISFEEWLNRRKSSYQRLNMMGRRAFKYEPLKDWYQFLHPTFTTYSEWYILSIILQSAHCANVWGLAVCEKAFQENAKNIECGKFYIVLFVVFNNERMSSRAKPLFCSPRLFQFNVLHCNTRCAQFCDFVHHTKNLILSVWCLGLINKYPRMCM